MPKNVDRIAESGHPMNWSRAFLSGALGAFLMMAFIDTFHVLGLTPFCFETYLGSLIVDSVSEQSAWTAGLVANLILGGLFGFFYAYFFEYWAHGSGGRVGVRLGLAHAGLAALAIFPYFTAIHDFMGLKLFARPMGFFGSGLGAATPILLLFGHLIFGATVGTFYGPVRAARVRMREFEPGETAPFGNRGPDVIGDEEDARDRVAV